MNPRQSTEFVEYNRKDGSARYFVVFEIDRFYAGQQGSLFPSPCIAKSNATSRQVTNQSNLTLAAAGGLSGADKIRPETNMTWQALVREREREMTNETNILRPRQAQTEGLPSCGVFFSLRQNQFQSCSASRSVRAGIAVLATPD